MITLFHDTICVIGLYNLLAIFRCPDREGWYFPTDPNWKETNAARKLHRFVIQVTKSGHAKPHFLLSTFYTIFNVTFYHNTKRYCSDSICIHICFSFIIKSDIFQPQQYLAIPATFNSDQIIFCRLFHSKYVAYIFDSELVWIMTFDAKSLSDPMLYHL